MSEKTMQYIKTDKNGTRVYHDYTCTRCCGTGGADKWKFTGWTCFKCGGSGKQPTPTVIKEYTPEYRKKLDERNAKRAKAKAESNYALHNKRFFENNGLDEFGNGFVYYEAYGIREILKEHKAKYNQSIQAWIAPVKLGDYQCSEITVTAFASACNGQYDYDETASREWYFNNRPFGEHMKQILTANKDPNIEAKLKLIDEGCIQQYSTLETLDGIEVNYHWCNTKFGTSRRVVMPDGDIVWTSARTEKALNKKGLKTGTKESFIWISINGTQYESDFNYSTGQRNENI